MKRLQTTGALPALPMRLVTVASCSALDEMRAQREAEEQRRKESEPAINIEEIKSLFES